MMRLSILAIIVLSFTFVSCEKQSIQVSFTSIEDYFPIQKGRSLTYRLDSTIYNESNNTKSIRSHIVRDVLDTSITDNLGITNYVFKRSIRNKVDTTKWDLQLTYRITIDSAKLIVSENNLRFIKLVSPLREGFDWRGNSYINTAENTELSYFADWQYTYGKINSPETINNIVFPETILVIQKNDTVGNPVDRKQYAAILYSKEIYAKQKGLIYKELIKETWQPPNSSNPNGYFEKNSFGIKLSILNISK